MSKHCGAPAVHDIKKQSYTCRFCGQETGYGSFSFDITYNKLYNLYSLWFYC